MRYEVPVCWYVCVYIIQVSTGDAFPCHGNPGDGQPAREPYSKNKATVRSEVKELSLDIPVLVKSEEQPVCTRLDAVALHRLMQELNTWPPSDYRNLFKDKQPASGRQKQQVLSTDVSYADH